MKLIKVLVLFLLLIAPLYGQGTFIYKEGTVGTSWSAINLEFYCWSFMIFNGSTSDTLYVTTDAQYNPSFTLKVPPYSNLGVSTYVGFDKLYIRSTGNNNSYRLITTTTGGRR